MLLYTLYIYSVLCVCVCVCVYVISAQGMAALAGLVGRSENRELQVVVQRAAEAHPTTLTLVPCKWEGRGLLGCHLQPLSL
jgi:26S proteasome non-ATPase regulatory subunit 9